MRGGGGIRVPDGSGSETEMVVGEGSEGLGLVG